MADKGENKQEAKHPKRGEPVTLAPLTEIEALRGLLATPPPPKKEKKRSKKSEKSEDE